MLFEHILGPTDKDNLNRWDRVGITPKLFEDETTAVSDFQQSLNTEGAIVIYMGHTFFPRGLKHEPGGLVLHGVKPERNIKSSELVKWLNSAKASIVIMAACSSDKCMGALDPKQSTVVVATYSGDNATTNTLQWAAALEVFLNILAGSEVNDAFKLIQKTPGTVDDAIEASASAFRSDDHFALARGPGSRRMLP